jgi:hypothetical protein
MTTKGKDILALFGFVEQTEAISDKTSEKYIQFDNNIHLTFGDTDPQLKYESRKADEKIAATTVKYGQLKLFLAELQFFNFYYNPTIHFKPVCLYIGAALGTHIGALANMYPMIEFHLYDPEEFNMEVLKERISDTNKIDIQNGKNIKIYKQFFEDKDMDIWKKKQENGSNIFLMVDIRNKNYKRIENVYKNQDIFKKNEKLVIDDMLLQQKWFYHIKPTKALLKMRLPYYETFLTSNEIEYEYLDGIVYRQQFASQTSTETRLVPFDANIDGTYQVRKWNIIAYEQVNSSHNKVLREKTKFKNPFSFNDPNIRFDDLIAEKIGLYNDYDSTAATVIITNYLLKFGVNPTYFQFYALAKEIFIDVGRSIIWNHNLAGIRQSLNLPSSSKQINHFIDEDGNPVEQNVKNKYGTEDPEYNNNNVE